MPEIPYERLQAIEALLGGRAAIEAAHATGKSYGSPASVAIVTSAQTWSAKQDFQAPSQNPGSPVAGGRILDQYGNVLRSFGPRVAGPPALAKFAATLQSGLDNASLVIVGDSTCASVIDPASASARWPALYASALASAYPNLNVTINLWSDGSQTYPGGASTVAVQSGKSGPTLTIYVFSVSGKNYEYFMNPTRLDAGLSAQSPDAVMICLGKNEGNLTATNSLWRITALVARIQARNPQAEIAHIVQNPNISPASQLTIVDELRKSIYESARASGCDVIDVLQGFRNTGSLMASTYIGADGIHPTLGPGNTGAQLQADIVNQTVRYEPGSPPRTFAPPPTTIPAYCPLVNADFQQWSSTGPVGWTLSNATVAQDAANTDEDQAFGFNMQATAAGAQVYAYQDAPAWFLAAAKGRTVTASVMVYIPAGQTINNAQLKILDGVAGYTWTWTGADSFGGGFMLLSVTAKIASSASEVRVLLYGDGSTTGSCNITWGKVWLGFGGIPRQLGRDSRLARLSVLGSTSDREQAIRHGSLAAFRQSYDLTLPVTSQAVTSGTLIGALVPVLAGESYAHAAFRTAGTPTTFGSNNDGHWYIAVYDETGAKVTQTADQGVTALGSSSFKALALQATVTPTYDAAYTVMLMVYVGTGGSPAAPSISSSAPMTSAPNNVITGLPRLGYTASAGQTTGTPPSPLTGIGSPSNIPWMALYT